MRVRRYITLWTGPSSNELINKIFNFSLPPEPLNHYYRAKELQLVGLQRRELFSVFILNFLIKLSDPLDLILN
jgi:hypothetical protein